MFAKCLLAHWRRQPPNLCKVYTVNLCVAQRHFAEKVPCKTLSNEQHFSLAKCLLKYYNQYNFIKKHARFVAFLRRRETVGKRGSLEVEEQSFRLFIRERRCVKSYRK